MKKLLLLLLFIPALGQTAEVYLTLGQNHNFNLGAGYSSRLDIEQPLSQSLNLHPYGSVDRNEGFHDRLGGLDLDYTISPLVTLSVGAEYDKYELIAADDPTETHDIHTSVKIRLW